MSFLIDTCVISEVVRPRPNRSVINWLQSTPEEHIYLSVITLGELQKGVLRLTDATKANRLQQWLQYDIRQRFSRRLLLITTEIALQWGQLLAESELAGKPRPAIDALIAATARHHQLTLVTRNINDFLHLKIPLFSPWE